MPAKSKAMRKAAAIAMHHPDQLHVKNRGLARMSLEQLAHYASTPERRLPAHVKEAKKR